MVGLGSQLALDILLTPHSRAGITWGQCSPSINTGSGIQIPLLIQAL